MLNGVSVVIPAYNEEMHIARIISDAQAYVDAVLVVDDGSSDATAAIPALTAFPG